MPQCRQLKGVLSVALVGMLLSSCAGITVIAGQVRHEKGCDEVGTDSADNHGHAAETTADVLRMHGEPAQIIRSSSGEYWRYPAGWKWRGIVGWVMLPVVPLVVPVGTNYRTLNMTNGVCSSQDIESSNFLGEFQCGFFPDGHGAMADQCGRLDR